MFDDMHSMMSSPLTYVLLALLIAVVVFVLVAVRLRAAKETKGADPRHDPQLR